MENYNRALMEYLQQYPDLQSYPYFNTTNEILGNTSIITSYGSTFVKRYMGGAGIKAYDFALVYMGQQDSGTSDINAVEMFNAEKFIHWIEKQNEVKNFPNFENAKVISIESLQNQPNFVGTNEGGNIAKYMIQFRITYYKR